MSEVTLTAEQKEAIYSSGHNILVSASAGSGKTFVMANRIVEKIKAGIGIDSLFISTFTRKAASELRTRLEKDLKKASRQSQDSLQRKRIYTALQQLSTADIGTMDSFTQKLLREHFNRVNVNPNFRILADKSESDLLQQEVFESLVEDYLSEKLTDISKENFEKLIRNFSKDRNILGFQEVVYKIYRFAVATENPEKWLENDFLQGFLLYQNFAELPAEFTDDVKQDLRAFLNLLNASLVNGAISSAKSQEKVQIILDNEEELEALLAEGKLTEFVALFSSLDTDVRPGSSKDDEIALVKKEFSAQKADLVGSNSKPGRIRLFINQVKHAKIIEQYQPEALAIAENLQIFLQNFYQNYLKRKIDENAFEYSDIAHFAIRILSENPDVATYYRAKYQEIMIDEYQDTSHVQEEILRLLSKNGDGTNNLFMVGDIKQSIYGFRLADPSLFLQKYNAYEFKTDAQLIRLKENFRSRGEVLEFTNEVFKHLMDEKIGEMTYGSEEELIQGNTTDYPATLSEKYYPELLLYKENGGAEAEEESEQEKISDGEIKVAAQEIQRLLTEEKVSPQNIAVLVRSKSNNNKIEDIFRSYAIPVVLDEGRVDFLKSIEVLLMLDVLRAIDNPLYDISLVATLRSPMFAFNEDELTRISLQSGHDVRFWKKIQQSLDKTGRETKLINSSLEDKIRKFMNQFTRWRKLVNEIPIHELLWQIYTETYYFDYVGALQNGELRQANLQALSSRAESYEASGYKGLFKFIKMIDRFMAQNNDLASVNIKLPQDAVRVMTFHKSKGLEFDYVFLMNLQSKFNERDLKDNVILTREHGLGMKFVADVKKNPEVDTSFPYALVKMETLPYLMNKELKHRSGLSEEMRVLYVAFTRAKQKLYMIGKLKDKKTGNDEYEQAQLVQGILTDKYRDSSNGFQHWLLALDSAHKLPMQTKIFVNSDLQYSQYQFTGQPNFKMLAEASVKFDSVMEQIDEIKKARQIINYHYPNVAATELASIQTPSQVKKRSYEKQLELGEVFPASEFVRAKHFELLNFDKKKLTATEVGTAVHSFMQQVDFSKANLFDFQATLDGMNLSEELKNQVDIAKILTLFDTELGQMLVDNVDRTVKEAPFSMLRTDEIAKEQYIVRGICDGFVKFDRKIILFDYKTDHFRQISQVAEIKKRYEIQMALYATALKKAYAVNEVDKYLILLGGPDKVLVEKYDG